MDVRRIRVFFALVALLLLTPGSIRAERVWSQSPQLTLIRRLDHESWRTRHRAQKSLTRLLRQGVRIPPSSWAKSSLEVKARIGTALRAEAARRKHGHTPRSRPQFD